MSIDEADRQKVIDEINGCQERILETFVPTIIAVGLIAVADRDTFATVTLICAFVVLFGASLYTASLSYKIFRNACFIRALSDLAPIEGSAHWEDMLARFNREQRPPMIIGYETRTIAFIFMIFSLAYVYMFFEINALMAMVCGVLLFVVALRIFLIPRAAERYYQQWQALLQEQ